MAAPTNPLQNAGNAANDNTGPEDMKDDVDGFLNLGDAKSDVAGTNTNATVNNAPAAEHISHYQPPPIDSWSPETKNSRGFLNMVAKDLKKLLGARLKRNLASLPLGKCSAWGDFFVVGTDDSEEKKDHHLMCINAKTMLENGRADPIVSHIPFPEHIRDIHWCAPDMVLATSGNGHINLINVDNDRKLKLHTTIKDVHSDLVREIAVNKAVCGTFASGGFDQKLSIMNLSIKTPIIQSVKLDGIIGSVKWPICNQNVCVSCTLDKGVYMIWDIRQPMKQPAFLANMGKEDLYTHERYTDHNVILGFGDGEIQHIDMRIANRILHRTVDPYVRGIGTIDYNSYSNSFLVSGLGDFSVWKHDTPRGVAQVWSHSLSAKETHTTGDSSSIASFLSDNSVLASTSGGMVGIYDQEFEDVEYSSN